MPCQSPPRLDAGQRTWFEWGSRSKVTGCLARMPGPFPGSRFPLEVPAEILEVLPDHYTRNWCRQHPLVAAAARSLAAGKLLTIDYGLTAGEFFQPDRRDGTLRAYTRHQPGSDLLADVGEQDLTAHVNFTALQQTGNVTV